MRTQMRSTLTQQLANEIAERESDHFNRVRVFTGHLEEAAKRRVRRLTIREIKQITINALEEAAIAALTDGENPPYLVGDPSTLLDRNDGFVSFHQVCLDQLGMQDQYACHYLDGSGGRPNLGEGIRFMRDPHDPSDYHAIRIHKDDVAKFILRVTKYKVESGQWPPDRLPTT